jgi:uncharacterized membrane protein YdbT with pleckstrin-like domain
VLQPNEQILKVGRLHWVVYHRAIFFFLAGLIVMWLESIYWKNEGVTVITGGVFAVLFLVTYIHGWFIRWTTELAVTDRRVIFKRGFINRHTEEMNMDKVASVEVDQSILGRILGYGTIAIMGAGQSIENLRNIADPIGLRNAITAK